MGWLLKTYHMKAMNEKSWLRAGSCFYSSGTLCSGTTSCIVSQWATRAVLSWMCCVSLSSASALGLFLLQNHDPLSSSSIPHLPSPPSSSFTSSSFSYFSSSSSSTFSLINADINECENPSICEQTCSNVGGSYSCSCIEGYSLASDLHGCLG